MLSVFKWVSVHGDVGEQVIDTLHFVVGTMKSVTWVLTLGAVLSLTSAASNPQQFTVDTGYAVFIGNQTRPNTVAYLGIPYAQPPLNDLRWRAPLPLDTAALANNKKTFDARSYPNFCVQGTTGNGDAGGAGTEDCLKVNIYAPTTATPESKCRF